MAHRWMDINSLYLHFSKNIKLWISLTNYGTRDNTFGEYQYSRNFTNNCIKIACLIIFEINGIASPEVTTK